MSSIVTDMILKIFLETHKSTMKSKAQCIFEGKEENEVDLKAVNTELFITEGDMKDVYQEHEIQKTVYAFNNKKTKDCGLSDTVALIPFNKPSPFLKTFLCFDSTVSSASFFRLLISHQFNLIFLSHSLPNRGGALPSTT